MKVVFLFLTLLGFTQSLIGQNRIISAEVRDRSSQTAIGGVLIMIEDFFIESYSEPNGIFSLDVSSLDDGEYILQLSKTGYELLRLPLLLNKDRLELDILYLQPDLGEELLQLGSINLNEQELEEESASGFSPILKANRDPFLNAAAFDFSQTFFRPRGYDNKYGTFMINGVPLNKLQNGRPQWSNWGGLNDVQRNQEFNFALGAVDDSFGGMAGTTNFTMRASQYSRGGRLSLSAANRSYRSRIMANYNSGVINENWYYSIAVSGRFAEEGYIDGTFYDAKSAFLAVERKLGKKHSINFTGIYAPNTKGKSAAVTDEVLELKDRKYNSYWGLQDGDIRNSRWRKVEEPILMLNHFWDISDNTHLNTNVAYQFGSVGNSRIDYGGTNLRSFNNDFAYEGGGSHPDPTYYQNLPSYFLRIPGRENYEAAYKKAAAFQENGQINWPLFYNANVLQASQGNNAIYAMAEDRNDDQSIFINTILDHKISNNLKLNTAINFRKLKSHNYAKLHDLFGAEYFLDIDPFAERVGFSTQEVVQSDLQNPNRLARLNDAYKYNYEFFAENAEAFAQLQFKNNRLSAYLGSKISYMGYYRNGIYQNGLFPESSLGKSNDLSFTNFGLKAGGTYYVNSRHSFSFNFLTEENPPEVDNSFANPRQNNATVHNIESEQLYSTDITYNYRGPYIKLRLTGYLSKMNNGTDVSFYYTDGLSGLGRNTTTAFVQEILYNSNKQHLGLEFGAEAQVTSTIKLKAIGALGEYRYTNNPQLYLTSNSFAEDVFYGDSSLKNYRLANGPQHAAQLGFEYRDPNYWWFGLNANYFANAFINVAPLLRTKNFTSDIDGLPLQNYDEAMARNLLKQERLEDYVLINAVGGKSWKLGEYYVGFFMSLNNVLDKLYRTGGYEQSRNANYTSLSEDRNRDKPVFGNKYWLGYGATYFANLYIRF